MLKAHYFNVYIFHAFCYFEDMKIIPVVGAKNSGKTTFLETLIPALKKKGLKVAVIKHDVHGFEMDHEGKDTYRLKAAGADAVCISSPQKIALIKDVSEEKALDVLARDFFDDFNVVLTEGYKKFPLPKIEVFRSKASSKPLCLPGELILLATDKPVEDFNAKQFSLEEVEKIANYLEKNVIEKPKAKIKARLVVNGQKVPMKSFIQELMAKTLVGMASSLKDVDDPKKIILEVELPQ
jgi:molybdopterin-guanine dinucleotide biosynthesis protein B